MSELKFSRVNNEEYNTVSVNIENAIIDIKEKEHKVIDRSKNKYGQTKAIIRILNDEIKDKLKLWEVQINDYLKCEVGTRAVTVLYRDTIYPKVSGIFGQEDKYQFKIKSIWINENNKPFAQLYYVIHMT